MLNGYRIMWMMVIFDLPVKEIEERKEATKFRNYLLDLGFEMVQYSVYMKHASGKGQSDALLRKVKAASPPKGDVRVISITDKQFARISHLGKKRRKTPETGQLLLF